MNEPRNLPPTPSGRSQESESERATVERITDLLDVLQSECARIRAWLAEARHQLAQHSTQIDQQLGRVVTLLEQLDTRTQSLNPIAAATAANTSVSTQDAPSSALQVCTFAHFQLRYGDRVLALGNNKKSNAILRYLVLKPDHCANKETLLELFWPDEPADKAAHKLHVAISELRQGLKELGIAQFIEFEDERYCLNPTITLWLDADEFIARFYAGQQLERQGQVDQAIAQYEAGRALYGGDFLVEDLYADWAAALRARLEELYLTLLGRLAACYFDCGRYEECVACSRQIVERDSFREDAYRQLMMCYVRMGQRNQALRVYQECVQILQRELGVAPMRETVALYEQIMQL